jgi:hypothetical protein
MQCGSSAFPFLLSLLSASSPDLINLVAVQRSTDEDSLRYVDLVEAGGEERL